MIGGTDDLHVLTLTMYPEGPGPYDRWELTVAASGELLARGDLPPADDADGHERTRQAIGEAAATYHERIDRGFGV